MRPYCEDEVSRIAAALSEAITATIAGQEGWALVGELFLKFFPGAAFSMSNYDPHAQVPCTAFGFNWRPDFIVPFEQHYSAMNPWTKLWEKLPTGHIMVPERMLPASSLKGRPFYEEWLKPHGDVDAGAGIKLKGEGGWVLHTAIHFPQRYSDAYEAPMVTVLRRIRQLMILATDSSIQVARGWIEGATSGALTPINEKIGFVIDGRRHLHRATPAGELFLQTESLCHITNGELSFTDRDADRWLGMLLFHLRSGSSWPVTPHLFSHQDRPWRGDIWLLPRPPSLVPVVAPERFLLVLTDLAASEHRDGLAHLARLYRLTDAEKRVCSGLAAGQTTSDFAEAAGLSLHTVRSQLKSAMRKMDCHRQADLMGRIVRVSQ